MTNTTHYVVITGAAKGLGLAIAKQAIHNGYYVIGIGRNVSEEFINISENQQTFIEFDFNNGQISLAMSRYNAFDRLLNRIC